MKMYIFKKAILILVFQLFYQLSIADCGHCFSIVKTKIIYTNGNIEISNLKFFGEYMIEDNYIKPKENESIKKYFTKDSTVQLIDFIYQLENLPPFINRKDRKNVELKEIKDIYLLEWTTIHGAGELPYLSGESIERIINSDTLFVNTKIFGGYDEMYIYTGAKLSLEDFNVLIKESYNYADLEPAAISRLKIDKRKDIYPNEVELNKAFETYFKEINRSICISSEIKINKEIDEYFQNYMVSLEKKKRYLELVLEYLNTKMTNDLEDFILTHVKGDYYKNVLLKEIHKKIDKKNDLIKNTIDLATKLYVFKEDHILNEAFYNVLKKEGIIVLPIQWD
ncbi:hypothetical protein [Dokdonia sp.]|uniref:hypothetical protein n=1 Tax=Dokdonia sp. TaxID=2024995 RepID=UPI003264D54D